MEWDGWSGKQLLPETSFLPLPVTRDGLHCFYFIGEKPRGKVAFKLNDNTDTTAIDHFVVRDSADGVFLDFFDDIARNAIS